MSIEDVVRAMDSEKAIFQPDVYLHERGLSLVCMGAARKLSVNQRVKALLMVEMAVRLGRHLLRERLRKAASADGAHRRHAVSAWLNLLLGNGPAAMSFWGNSIKLLIVAKYGDCLTAREMKEGRDLRIVGHVMPGMLLRSILHNTMIEIDHGALLKWLDNPHSYSFADPSPFSQGNCDISPRITVINPRVGVMSFEDEQRRRASEQRAKVIERIMNLKAPAISLDMSILGKDKNAAHGDWELMDSPTAADVDEKHVVGNEPEEWQNTFIRGVKDMLRPSGAGGGGSGGSTRANRNRVSSEPFSLIKGWFKR